MIGSRRPFRPITLNSPLRTHDNSQFTTIGGGCVKS
jgi:hypothetical protein